MSEPRFSRLGRVLREERAQVLPLVALMLVALLGMAALVIDLGSVYFSFRELQASTDAAALAGAQSLPSASAASVATSYSAVPGAKNAYGNLPGVTMVTGYPLLRCLNALTGQGIACVAPANANAIQVKQQVDVHTYFARILGVTKVHLSASATAAMRGAIASPYNVAIIVDTTASMGTTDSYCSNKTRLACALAGVQVLLAELSPCAASLPTCSISNGVATNSVDRVSLFTFPNPTIGTVSKAYDCSSSNPTILPYSFPTAGASLYAPTGSSSPTYQVTSFLSDYRTSDTAGALNNGSNLTMAIGAKSGCSGMGSPGGEGTYYAGVIYAAEGALLAEQAANPGSQNVMILLSDGDSTASQSQMASTATNNGSYPSWVDQCGQAIVAAQAAAAAGIRVFAVAYGSSGTGCATDTNNSQNSKGITPCQTMERIASAPQNFYSDWNQSGSGSSCQSASQSTTDMSQIFSDIGGDLTLSRLIPDGTT